MSKPDINCFTPPASMLSVEIARERLLDLIKPVSEMEYLPLKQSLDRILATDIESAINIPSFDNSAMDGYAVNSQDSNDGQTTTLKLIGKSFAGHPFPGVLQPGECVRIMTGAPIPDGCDAVIMQECVETKNDVIHCKQTVKRGDNVRYIGEDIKANEPVLVAGHRIRPADVGLLASIGKSEVPVIRRLKVAFFSTGDELSAVGTQLQHGQIYDSNRYIIASMLNQAPIDTIDMGVIADDKEQIEQAILNAAKISDIIITSGGVSVGEADYVKDILDKLGEIHFWRVAMKPGKPLAIGSINNAFFIGLPGNPVSVMATFYQFAQAALYKMMGFKKIPSLTVKAKTTKTIEKNPGRAEFQRGVLSRDDNNDLTVSPVALQGSHILTSMSKADCFILLAAENTGVEPGQLVEVQPFDALM